RSVSWDRTHPGLPTPRKTECRTKSSPAGKAISGSGCQRPTTPSPFLATLRPSFSRRARNFNTPIPASPSLAIPRRPPDQAARRGRPAQDVRSLLRNRVLDPIGIATNDWSVGYDQTVEIDGLPLVACWGGGSLTPDAAARIGRLMLRKGDWQGQTLLSEQAV